MSDLVVCHCITVSQGVDTHHTSPNAGLRDGQLQNIVSDKIGNQTFFTGSALTSPGKTRHLTHNYKEHHLSIRDISRTQPPHREPTARLSNRLTNNQQKRPAVSLSAKVRQLNKSKWPPSV